MGSRGRVESNYQRELHLADEDKQHVLERHRYSSNYPNKTNFPKDWNDKRILDSIEKTLDAPDKVIKPIFPNDRHQVEKVVDGVTVRVSYYHKDGAPVFHSAYPVPNEE
jgi:hypothetical protein